MITKKSLGEGKILVTFELPSAVWAESVSLVGDFNDWNMTSHPLCQTIDDGRWYIEVILEAGKEYSFRYLVNGTDWHNDWHADKYAPNPFGGDDSVVIT